MQIKRTFDHDSVIKILKGAGIAGTGAFALYVLNAVGAMEFENPMLISLIAWIVPTLTNLVKEWMKGK